MQPGVKIFTNVALPTTTDSATEMMLTVMRKPITVGVCSDYLQPGVRGFLTTRSNSLTPLGELHWSDHCAQPENTSLESLQYQAYYQTKPVRAGGFLSYPVILDFTRVTLRL